MAYLRVVQKKFNSIKNITHSGQHAQRNQQRDSIKNFNKAFGFPFSLFSRSAIKDRVYIDADRAVSASEQ